MNCKKQNRERKRRRGALRGAALGFAGLLLSGLMLAPLSVQAEQRAKGTGAAVSADLNAEREAAAQQSAKAAQKLRAEGRQVRAVTYFGEEWPINFWSSEFRNMDADFAQIREDGFNSIILCVPWNEFQPRLGGKNSPINEDAVARLRIVMQKAEAAKLSVFLRLGYTWDYYGNAAIPERYAQLVTSDAVRDAFLAYASRIYQEVSGFENFAGAFLTWEDFWNYLDEEKRLAGTYFGKSAAKASGYTAYVQAHYTEAELTALYGSRQAAQEAAYPKEKSPAYRLFLEWYDTFLMDLLRDTQRVFPDLSFECRLDAELCSGGAAPSYYAHDATFDSENASYTSAMLSASMGYEAGTVLSAEEAAASGRNQLNRLMVTGKPVFVDQFLYMESTPGYENLPKLRASEMNTYLKTMGGVFRDLTMGYGIWTYRDYRDNQIYNPGFALGLDGWTALGGVREVQTESGCAAELKKGASLSQSLKNRNFLSENGMKVRFRITSSAPASVQIATDVGTKTVQVGAGEQTISLTFDKQAKEEVKLALVSGERVIVDDVRVYSHVTEGGIYGTDKQPGPYLEGIRALNQAMKG